VMLGISSRAVEKRLAQLKDARVIKRVGSAKGGHWEVVDG
jgi:ATP-dependent DNA helicase RecG